MKMTITVPNGNGYTSDAIVRRVIPHMEQALCLVTNVVRRNNKEVSLTFATLMHDQSVIRRLVESHYGLNVTVEED